MTFNETDDYQDEIKDLLLSFNMYNIMLKYHTISISGSSVLNILQNKQHRSDLDLYIQTSSLNNIKLSNLLKEILSMGYYLKCKDYDIISYILSQKEKLKICTETFLREFEKKNQNYNNNELECRKNIILNYIKNKKYTNTNTNTNLDYFSFIYSF